MERIKIGEDGASSIEMRQTGRNLNGSTCCALLLAMKMNLIFKYLATWQQQTGQC